MKGKTTHDHSTKQADSAPGKVILGLLGVVLSDLSILLGLECSPINIIGVGSGNACSATTVCCQNNAVVSDMSGGTLAQVLTVFSSPREESSLLAVSRSSCERTWHWSGEDDGVSLDDE